RAVRRPDPRTQVAAASRYFLVLLLLRRQIGTYAFEQFGRHADRFAQCGMRVDGLADVDRIASHLHGEADLADQVARMGADDAAAEQAVIGLIEQQFGESLVAPVGDRATRCGPRKHGLAVLDALRLALLLGHARP